MRMSKKLTLILFCFCLAAFQGAFAQGGPQNKLPVNGATLRTPTGAATSTQPKPGVPAQNVDTMTAAQFRALPLNATVSHQGRTMSKSDFIALRLRELEVMPKMTRNPSAQLPAVQMQLQQFQKQEEDFQAQNAKVRALYERDQQLARAIAASPQYTALSKEASDLVSRYQTASPTEKAQIQQRAKIVHDQLVELESGTLNKMPQ